MCNFLYFFITLILQGIGILGSNQDIPEPDVTCTATNPLPTGCGIRGNIIYSLQEYYAISSPQIVDNVEECASFCERRRYIKNKEYWGYLTLEGSYPDVQAYCQSFAYYTNTSACQLGKGEVIEYTKPSQKSNAIYYNAGCFDCGPVCQQPYGDQLIDTAKFQAPLLGPWRATEGSISKGYKSSKAYYCPEAQDYGCELSQEINMCKGSLYAIQFDYLTVHKNKTSAPPELSLAFGGRYFFEYTGEGGFYYHTVSENEDLSAWKSVRGYFQYLDNQHIGPYFRSSGGGSTSLDNIYVYRVPENPPLAANAKNLLKNPGFETGDLKFWTTHKSHISGKSPPFKVVKPGINSNYGILFKATYNPYAPVSMYLAQTVATKPNTTYWITFDLYLSDNPFEINLFIGPKNPLKQVSRYWTPGNYTFSTPVYATNTSTLVQFLAEARYPYMGKALMDNFKMLEVAKSAYFP